MNIAKEAYRISKKIPPEEKFGLISQMRRSAVSVSSNIVEGCGQSSDKDFKKNLAIAIGSAFELETQYLLCVELNFITNS